MCTQCKTNLVRSKNRCSNPVFKATPALKALFGAARWSLDKEGVWAHANAEPLNTVKHFALHSNAFIKKSDLLTVQTINFRPTVFTVNLQFFFAIPIAHTVNQFDIVIFQWF